MPRFIHFLSLAVLAGLTASCSSGPALYSVEGKVLFNEQPPVGALVIFFPVDNESMTAMVPSGTVNADGTFTLMTNGLPGAPAGTYKVVVQIPVSSKTSTPAGAMGADPEMKAPDKIVPGPFAERSTTTLTAEVKKSATKIESIRLP